MGMISGDFAVLCEHRRWRFFVLFMLYIAQGIPVGLLLYALPAYLAKNDADAASVATFLSFTLLPHAIKLINGPVMDRWTYWPMGKRRPWVLIAQLALIVTLASLALVPEPLKNLGLLTMGGFIVSFFIAFQDVATDGMAVDVLPLEDQPKASSIMFGGQIFSSAIVAAAGGWALDQYGVGVTSFACAGTVALIFIFPLISRERKGERLLPWSEGKATLGAEHQGPGNLKDIAINLKTYVLLPASVILIAAILLYTFGRGIHLALMPIYFVQELGWTDTEYSGLTGSALLIGGGFSILFGGFVLDYFGRCRTYMIIAGLVAILGIGIAAAPSLGASDLAMKFYRLCYVTLDTLAIVSFIAVAMALCTRKIAATQFALYMAISNVGFTAGSAAFGSMQSALSYPVIFLVFAAVTFCSIFVMRSVSVNDHNARTLALQTEGAR